MKNKRSITLGLISILLLVSLVMILSCSKHKEEPTKDILPTRDKVKARAVENVTVDKAIQDALNRLNIPIENCKRIKKEDAIYYYIPVNPDSVDLDFADMIVSGKIGMTDTRKVNDITINEVQAVREYYDPVHNQSYVIKIYLTKKGTPIVTTENTIRPKKALLAIVVDDFGQIGGRLLTSWVEMPKEITFAILPHLKNSRLTMQKAASAGHEILVHIPMEPINYPKENPGNNPILVSLDDTTIQTRIASYFKELNYAVGGNNHMGSRASLDDRVMKAVMKSMHELGVFYLDSKTIAGSLALKNAQKAGVPSVQRDLFLDAPTSSDAIITQRLADLKNLQKYKKAIVVITHCHDQGRLTRLQQFISKAEDMGFVLVPVSKLTRSSLPLS